MGINAHYLQDKDKNRFYPYSHADASYDRNGVKVGTRLDEIDISINNKIDKIDGKGLSTNDYTTTDKNKLDGIESNAQVNIIENVKVNGMTIFPSSKAVDITVPVKTSQLTNDSGFKTTDTNTWIAFKGATTSAAGTAGYAPAPAAGDANRYLRSDGTWSVPPDNNTTYTLSSITGILAITKGGTDSTTADGGRANLGATNIVFQTTEPTTQNVGDLWFIEE